MPLVEGASFGVYEDIAPLGAGGMGEVWRARDPRLQREVALKVLPATAETDESARKRLLREARMASKLNHPHVCTIYEVGEADGQAFIAMELVEGESLADRLSSGPLPKEQILRYGEQVAEALEHAHSRGVVHRDLKCANVVITPEGRAKVLDFGLAGRLRGETHGAASTQSMESTELSGKIAGTLPYMAPEQLRGQPADTRSDLWSLGVMLYEMAAGKLPFRGNTGFELSSAILGQPAPPLPQTATGEVPTQLQVVIDHCLEKDPDARYQRAGEVRVALEMTRTGSEVRLPSASPATRSRRSPLAAAASIVAPVATEELLLGEKRSFFHELWRRKVLRVVAAYMAGVWFLLKMGEVIVSTLGLPDWSYRALVLVVIIGCPLSALFAWLFEITPEGIKLQSEVDRHGLPTRTGRVLTYFILVSVILAGAISIRTYISTDHARPSTKPVPGTAKTTSIAVLPFSNMSADAENEYFADGLSEELLNLLAKIQELKVVGRTSSFSFKGKHEDLREIGQKLNVATVLEGSVRKSGQSVRITAQLVNAEDGFHLWSETYDRTMEDIFVLQDEIASKVVEALKVTLLGHELESRDVSAETDPAAYDEYLRGMYHHRQRGPSDLEAAVQSYERALAIDPLFASAHAGLALTHTARAVMSYVPAEEGYALAELEVRRAIALRPDLAQPQYILGTIRMIRDWDWQGAEESFGRALELDPSNLSAVRGASDIAMIMGRREESVALAKRVAAADPLASTANFVLGIRQYQAGHFDDAKMTLERTLDLHPGSYMVPAAMAKVLIEKGEPQRALDVILSEPSELWRLAVLPIVYHALGREDDAERVLSELIEGYSEVAAFQIAEAYAVLGGEDEAFRWLEIAYEQRDPAMIDLISFPTLASLRQDPRFDSLRERMGLPEPDPSPLEKDEIKAARPTST